MTLRLTPTRFLLPLWKMKFLLRQIKNTLLCWIRDMERIKRQVPALIRELALSTTVLRIWKKISR